MRTTFSHHSFSTMTVSVKKMRNIYFTKNIYFTNKVEVSQNEQGDRVNLLLLSAAMIILINATVGLIVAYPKFYVIGNEKCFSHLSLEKFLYLQTAIFLFKMSYEVHLFSKQCLHDLHFKVLFTKPFQSSPLLASAEVPCFHKVKKHCFKSKWILGYIEVTYSAI